MRIKKRETRNGNKEPSKLIKIILFWTVFFFFVFIEKSLIGSSKSDLDQIIRAFICFNLTIIITGILLRYSTDRILKITIPVAWVITILLAIT